MSRPISRSLPSSAQAARIASISAWAVGSWSSRVRLPARATTLPLRGIDDHAPTGVSARAKAARASARAASMCGAKRVMAPFSARPRRVACNRRRAA